MLKRWNLIEARKRKGLLQKDVGKILGIVSNSYAQIELGINEAKQQYQEHLEKLFEVPREKLFAIVEPPKHRMLNNYEIRGDITAIFMNGKNGEVIETIIDTADLERVSSVPGTWSSDYNIDGKVYVKMSKTKDGRKTSIRLHRFIMDAPNGYLVDHINHDTLDNRRSVNLRLATTSENAQNRKGATRINKTGIRGVRWYEKNKKWVAHANINGKKTTIGYFDNISEAEEAAKEARRNHMPYSQEALAK